MLKDARAYLVCGVAIFSIMTCTVRMDSVDGAEPVSIEKTNVSAQGPTQRPRAARMWARMQTHNGTYGTGFRGQKGRRIHSGWYRASAPRAGMDGKGMRQHARTTRKTFFQHPARRRSQGNANRQAQQDVMLVDRESVAAIVRQEMRRAALKAQIKQVAPRAPRHATKAQVKAADRTKADEQVDTPDPTAGIEKVRSITQKRLFLNPNKN